VAFQSDREGDLARELGVSPGTVRKALDKMEADRLVVRRQGRGTFVVDQASIANRFDGLRQKGGSRMAWQPELLKLDLGASTALEQQRSGHTRAQEVMEIEAGLLKLYEDPALDTKPKLLEERGGAFYSEAAAQLMASLHAGTGDVQVVNIRNDGAIPNVAEDAVVEISAQIGRHGAEGLDTEPLAPELLGLVEHAKAYERLAVRAAKSGSRREALLALLANPLVPDYTTAAPLLDALLEANQAYLPRFFTAA
jgi:alpha-galactosidase/6-phospho-beta-glucosidase family protein